METSWKYIECAGTDGVWRKYKYLSRRKSMYNTQTVAKSRHSHSENLRVRISGYF